MIKISDAKEFSDLEGKTIAKAFGDRHFPAQLVLVFDDDTVLGIGWEHGWESGDGEIVFDNEFDDDIKVQAGLMTQKEMDAKEAEQSRLKRETAEQREREEYERLRKKFGS